MNIKPLSIYRRNGTLNYLVIVTKVGKGVDITYLEEQKKVNNKLGTLYFVNAYTLLSDIFAVDSE